MKSRIIFIISILCLILASPIVAELTITLPVTQDAAIRQANPDTNLDGQYLYLTQYYKAYIQFDVSKYAGTVLSVDNFEFNFNATYARDAQAYLITGGSADDWDEKTITWNNAPGNDTASGAFFLTDSTYTSTLLGAIPAPTAGGSSTVKLLWANDDAKAAFINELNTGNRIVTIGLARNASNRFAQYACKEQAPAYHPVRVDMTFDTLDLLGNVIFAQPESREVYFGGEIIDTATTDPDTARIAYTDTTPGLYDGNLMLAFRLPELPAGQVIKSAVFNWLYIGHGSRTGPAHDLYGLTYRPAASTPITVNDYYVGASDSTAVRIGTNVTDFAAQGQWHATSEISKLLTAYIQAQYDAGAQADDWVVLRFNPVSMMNVYVLNTIAGPNASVETNRPYIEIEFADASEGYWKALSLSNAGNIISTGLDTTQPNYFVGATPVNDVHQTIDILWPFRFPQLDSNEYIGQVLLITKLSDPYGLPGRYFDIDMYGLPYRVSSAFAASDYWFGPYALLTEEGLNGTPIASAVTEDYATQPATFTLDETASLRAACYMNDQKAAGATSSSYGFFRFNPRYNALYYTRQQFGYPELTVKVVNTAPVYPGAPATEYACATIGYLDYPVADENGDCQVNLEDMKIVLGRWLECFAEPASYYCP